MVPIKGLDELLDACVILRTQGIRARLYLIGDGPLMNNLTGRVRRSGLADSVRFVGKVIHETLADWYRSANLTVLPSRSEGIPNVLYESTACGTPFVANDVGGVSEIADLHLDAVVPPGNAEAFAAAIRDRLHSGATGPRLRLPSTWYEHGLALEALFRRILIARQAPGAGPTAY
jgi:glycosyltransferase involved in cell wall biosynthesis